MTNFEKHFNPSHQSVFTHVLWLYGLYSLLNMGSYLFGYYLLPEGFMRGSPQSAVGEFVASATSFWSEFALTLLFNLGLVVGLSVILNLNQVKGFPMGYILPITLGIVSGLISGTNSFAASDLKQFNAWDGARNEHRRAGNAGVCADCRLRCWIWDVSIQELVDLEEREIQKLS